MIFVDKVFLIFEWLFFTALNFCYATESPDDRGKRRYIKISEQKKTKILSQ